MKPLLHEERPFRVVADVDTDRYGGRVYSIDRFESEEHARHMMLFSDEDILALYRDGPGEVEVLEGEPLPTYEGEAYDRFGRPLSAEQCLEAARRAMEAREAHDAASANKGGRRSKLNDEDRAAIVEALDAGEAAATLARRYRVSAKTIYRTAKARKRPE